MKRIRRTLRLVGIKAAWLALAAAVAHAQDPAESGAERDARFARRGAGLRVGSWKVEEPREFIEFSNSLHLEIYFQRGVDQRLALENSASVWRRITQEIQSLPLGEDRVVETKSYIVPLLTSLKFYPVTSPANVFEPYLVAGVGFAIGIVDEAENAIGGGGTSVATGFGLKAGVGFELHLTSAFGLVAGSRFQWTRFGEDLGSQDTFRGAGFDGGVTYRFPF